MVTEFALDPSGVAHRPDHGDRACWRGAADRNDDGTVTVTCTLHGRVGQVSADGGSDHMAMRREAEAVDALWCAHTGRPDVAAGIRSLAAQEIDTIEQLTAVHQAQRTAFEQQLVAMRLRHRAELEALRRVHPHSLNPAHIPFCDGTCRTWPDTARCPMPDEWKA